MSNTDEAVAVTHKRTKSNNVVSSCTEEGEEPLSLDDVRLVASDEVEEKDEEEVQEKKGKGKGKGKEKEQEKLSKSLPGGSVSEYQLISPKRGGQRPKRELSPRTLTPKSTAHGSLILRSPGVRSYSRVGRPASPNLSGTPSPARTNSFDEDTIILPSENHRLPLHSQSPVVTRFADSISVPHIGYSVDLQTKRRMRKLLRSLEDMEDRLVHDYDQLPGLREMFEKELQEFAQAYFNYLCTSNDKIMWQSIKPIPQDLLLSSLPPSSFEEEKFALSKSVILRLNGGKHSSLNTVAPECCLEIRPGLTFLGLAVKQAIFLAKKYDEPIDLAFLNSFLTHEETVKILQDYDYDENVDINVFTQSRFPLLSKDTHQLVPENFVGERDKWYPPGTGDVLATLLSCGMLKEWIKQGKEIIFISNVDNLGATYNPTVANYMLDNNIDYLSEVTPYTPGDSHRSFITQYLGAPKVVAGRQLPSDKKEAFLKQNHAVYTGNSWINLHALLKVMEGGNLKSLDVHVKSTTYQGKTCIQFERKLASAIPLFENSAVLVSPRSRFIPVRSANDLFLAQSNLYTVNKEEGTVSFNNKRPYDTLPMIRLGANFQKHTDYKSRFEGIPSVLELDRLTLGGDVRFGSNVTLGGSVIIMAKDGGSITIPSGAVLENKIVNGCLNVLQH